MKQRYYVILPFVLLAFILQNCTEEQNVSPEKVQFAFNPSTINGSAGRISSDLPDGTALRITLEKSNGETVFTNQRVELLKMNDHYMTEPVALSPGRYVIVDFMLVDESSNVSHATPKKGSSLADVVDHPLPFAFNVSKDKLTTVDMQVVDVKQQRPEDFGYASFNVNVVGFFQLAVFKPTGEELELTEAEAFLLNGGDTVDSFDLRAEVNQLTLNHPGDAPLTLVIIKDGYARYSKSFDFDHLQEELNRGAMEVILEPALTIRMEKSVSGRDFLSLVLGAAAGAANVNVDWGDGSQDSYTIDNQTILEHNYDDALAHFISITGDLADIEMLELNATAPVKSISLHHMPALSAFSTGYLYAHAPRILDFSQNHDIRSIEIYNARFIEKVILPDENRIDYLSLSGSTGLTTAEVDQIINKVYNSVAEKARTGTIGLATEIYAEDPGMIGPPSAEAMEQLQELEEIYEWEVWPDPN